MKTSFPFRLSFSPIPSSEKFGDEPHRLRFSSSTSPKNPARHVPLVSMRLLKR
jgi:hypothetical protein